MSWTLLIGSLGGVLALALIARLLRLGGAAIGDAEEAVRLAEEALSGFVARHAFLSADHAAAAVVGVDGTLALVKRHGAQFAVRRLTPPVAFTRDGATIAIDSGERLFGRVKLTLAESDETRNLADMIANSASRA